MSIKNILRKAAELVVEIPEKPFDVMDVDTHNLGSPGPTTPATKSVEEIIREAPGPNLDEIKIAPDTSPVLSAPAGQVDFAQVYAKAGLPAVAFSAEQALDVIHSLPGELPLDVRRATVNATIQAMGKAMGVNTESVIADAGRKVAALSAYEDLLKHQADLYIQSLEVKIADLENQISQHRAETAKTKEMLGNATAMCDAESSKLEDVLEFFTLDVQPSRNA